MFVLVTGERIAVEYLLAQTNKGDLLAPKQMPEIPSQVLEDEEESDNTGDLRTGDPWYEAESETTLCLSAELGAGDPSSPPEDQVLLEGDAEPEPVVTEVRHTFSNSLHKNTVFNKVVNLVIF